MPNKPTIRTFFKKNVKHLKIPLLVWTAFILFELCQDWYFQPELFQNPGFILRQLGLLCTVYYSWLVMTFLIGFSQYKERASKASGKAKWLKHLLIAVLVAVGHLLLTLLCLRVFLPNGANIDLQTVWMELVFKWFIIEVIIYFAVVWYWERILVAANAIQSDQNELLIKTTEGILKCQPQQVDWVLAEGNYISIQCMGKVHKARSTLSAMQNNLGPGFYRAHRSVLVNDKQIHQILDNRIVLKDGKKLPISQNKRAQLLKTLQV